ncbi:MAG: aspartate aminotransferase family protein [Actinobacteria bacterium]|nr:aspartate aminotransferase family protein [Actinomycetota bacterium]
MSTETRLWHPFADMATVDGNEFVVSRAEGVWLWDEDDRRYLDATASLWYVNVGHGREEIAEAVAAQLRRLDCYSIFNDYANRPALELAERLSGLAPVEDSRVFLGTGGGDAIETAAKLARRYWHLEGQPGRTHLIGRTGGFHGAYGFGTSVGGIDANREGFGPLMGDTSQVAYDSLEALEGEIVSRGADRVAAVFVEPVIGAGGVLPPPEGYLEGVAELCRRHQVLLVMDEVICAFGRLGAWFASERFGLRPDMIVFAKAVTSGYQPVGGVIVSGRIAAPFWSRPGHSFRTGPTYAGHPACCAAALVNLDIIEREGLNERARELEVQLKEALDPLLDHELVGEVRAGLGVMAAVEIAPDALAAGVTVADVFRATRERGVLTRPLATSLGLSPPLTIGEAELALIPKAIEAALEAHG